MNSDRIKEINILVVEDDPLNRTLVEGFLSESTLPISKVKSAESLNDALEFLDKDEFDVVLLDLNLPDSKELDTLDRVVRKHPYLAIVVITGEYGEDLGLKAIAGGAQEYLVKANFNKEVLSKSIYYAFERKQAEEDTRLAYKELEKTHKELKKMQSQMVQSEKMASIGALAAGVAHEINTPVGFVASNFETLNNYIRKFCELITMYEDITGKIDTLDKVELKSKAALICETRQNMHIDFILEDIEELLSDSKEGLERVTNIVQNLRDFSRIDQAEDFDEHDLNSGIEATLVVARNEIKYDCNIQTDFSQVPTIFCNSDQINQVFLNILVNAAQAIKTVEREDKGNITIKTYATEEEVVCEITDDGPGIPPDKLTKIFDPFFTTKPVGKGTGLGLSVSYDIVVNKHEGELLVDSTVGKGTTFAIKLPIKWENQNKKKELETDEKENRVICG